MSDIDGSITRALRALQDGDRDPVRRLWEEYFHRLVGLARGRLDGAARSVSDEEDVALSAFASFCRRAERGEFPHLEEREGLWRLLFVIMSNLGDLLRSAHRLDEGETLLRPAFAGLDRQLGPTAPATLRAMGNLAIVAHARGNMAEAEALYRRALEAFRDAGKARHPDYLSMLNNHAMLLQRREDLAGAEDEFRQLLATRRELLGAEHHDTLMTMNNLADLLATSGQAEEAESLLRELLGMLDRVPDRGATREVAAMAQSNLADLLIDQGKTDEAERLYKAALEAALSVWGPDHENTRIIKGKLAAVRQPRQGKPARQS